MARSRRKGRARLREQAHGEERDGVVRPRGVERLEEGGALGARGGLLEPRAQLDGLGRREQDQIELLHHLRGETVGGRMQVVARA